MTGSTIKRSESSRNGALLLWRLTTGVSTVATIDGAFMNGLAVSPDNATIFLNNDANASVTRVDIRTGKITGSVKMPRTEIPDNSSWASDGRLLVASIGLSPSFNYVKCDKIEDSFCDMPFEIVAIDPLSLKAIRFSGTVEGRLSARRRLRLRSGAISIWGLLPVIASLRSKRHRVTFPLSSHLENCFRRNNAPSLATDGGIQPRLKVGVNAQIWRALSNELPSRA